ncbi:MAG: MFS transporter, partial [Pseudomonadota bacterium]
MFDIKENNTMGRDFWLYRTGQFLSIVGDYCGSIAFAWWILDKTGSAAVMATILAPPMLVRIFMLPLLGPIGDRFSRKHIVFISDIWRAVFTFVIVAFVMFDYFSVIPIVIIYILLSIGSAAFHSVAISIVPQLVEESKISKAMRQSQTVMYLGMVFGGISGGFLVSILGVRGAFAVDGITFLISAVLALLIRAKTKPKIVVVSELSFIKQWKKELFEGFRFIYKVPVFFWLSIFAMLCNFTFAHLNVGLPVLVKETRDLPAWFLGSLESSIGIGSIIGALLVG